MDNTDLIQIKQLPVIEEQLRSVKENVEQITRETAALVCTEETVQTVKIKRAELNKMFADLEAKRKEVKAAVMEPYKSFEAVYEECISGPFKAADAALKEKINEVEAELKHRCEESLRTYFTEICLLHGVDFIRYDQAGIKIDLASAKAKNPQRLKDKIGEFVAGIAVGVDQINQMDDKVEIMAEYKKCLNVGQAASIVQERHRRIEEERKAAAIREESRRRQEEAIAKVDAAVPPVEALAPPVVQEVAPEMLTVTFAVTDTRERLVALREWMKANNYKYQ